MIELRRIRPDSSSFPAFAPLISFFSLKILNPVSQRQSWIQLWDLKSLWIKCIKIASITTHYICPSSLLQRGCSLCFWLRVLLAREAVLSFLDDQLLLSRLIKREKWARRLTLATASTHAHTHTHTEMADRIPLTQTLLRWQHVWNYRCYLSISTHPLTHSCSGRKHLLKQNIVTVTRWSLADPMKSRIPT